MFLCSSDTTICQRWQQGLANQTDITETHSIQQLEHYLSQNNHELVLLHLSVPDLQGVEDVIALRKKYPQTQLMAFSDVPDDHEALALLKFGIQGYSNAYLSLDLLAKAVNVVKNGEIWMGRKLMQRLMENLVKINLQFTENNDIHRLDQLTDQEKKITYLVAEGACNKIIGSKLNITDRTVKTHLTSIFKKTHTHNRLELAMLVYTQAEEMA